MSVCVFVCVCATLSLTVIYSSSLTLTPPARRSTATVNGEPARESHKSEHFLPLSRTSRGTPVLLQTLLTLFLSVHKPCAHNFHPPMRGHAAGEKNSNQGLLHTSEAKNPTDWPFLPYTGNKK